MSALSFMNKHSKENYNLVQGEMSTVLKVIPLYI